MNKLVSALILGVTAVASAQPAKAPPPPPAGNAGAPAMTAAQPVAGPTCYQLSRDGKSWSKTPERLCVGSGTTAVEIKLQTGMPTATDVATFRLDLKTRAKCMDCNKDVFALLNPENSVFNSLAITFDGKRDVKAGTETGTLTIGKTKFFYRK